MPSVLDLYDCMMCGFLGICLLLNLWICHIETTSAAWCISTSLTLTLGLPGIFFSNFQQNMISSTVDQLGQQVRQTDRQTEALIPAESHIAEQ